MTLQRFGLTIAAVLGALAEPTVASACAGYVCQNDQFLPRAGNVPANIPAIAWQPGYNSDQLSDASPTSAAPLPRFECRAPDGTTRAVRFTAMPADRPNHLRLDEPLVAGEHCILTSGVPDCPAEIEPRYLNGHAEFDVTAASPIPEQIGLIAVTSPRIGRVDVAANASCSEGIRSCTVRTSLELDAAAAPWKDVLQFETIVDGERFAIWHDQSIPNELGGLYQGRERDVVFAPIDAIPDNVHDFRQLDLGDHTLAIRAQLPGSDLIIQTPAVSILLDCEPDAQPELAEVAGSGDSGGCTVAGRLGSSQRQAGLFGSLSMLLGLLLMTARRRVR